MKSLIPLLLASRSLLLSGFAVGFPFRPHATAHSSLRAKIVITGSAGGVGYAYADEFLSLGHSVVISDVVNVEAALTSLRARHPSGEVHGTVCDVGDAASVQSLGEFAKGKLGEISHWINNAGINGGRRYLSEVPFDAVEAVVRVNLLGILYCTKIAMELMAEQTEVEGHIFNTVGSGVKGGGTPGYACYGATKRGLPQLTR